MHGVLAPAEKRPVRLKVAYKTPGALLSEFTRSVGKGSVSIESGRPLPIGTTFVFELHAQGVENFVEVYGKVLSISVTDPVNKKYLLNIRYEAPGDRRGLDLLLQHIFDSHQYEKVRKHPRIPIQLRATEDRQHSPPYIVRDISRGGLGIEVEAAALPKYVRVGVPFLLELGTTIGPLLLHGEVAWAFAPRLERTKWVNPGLGVIFGTLRADTVERLKTILHLHGLPPPPWKARVSFGAEAVKLMP